jgi:hypothetical protein
MDPSDFKIKVTAFVRYPDDQIKWNDTGWACGMHGTEMHTGGVRKSEQITRKIQSYDRRKILKLNWTVGGQVDLSGSAQALAGIVVKITVNIWVPFFIRFQADNRCSVIWKLTDSSVMK